MREKHALMTCSAHKDIREAIFTNIACINKNFNSLDNDAKFIWLLSNEDKPIILHISKLINAILTH